MKTIFHNEHVYETYLDMGVIGEQKVEVYYHWINGSKAVNCMDAPDPSGADVVAVLAWIDGKEIDITELLNANLLDDLAYECTEDYCGAI